MSMSKSLMVLEGPFSDHQNVCSQLLSYFCAILPEQIHEFVSPSLPFLARFWQDPMDDVMQSARTIFISSVDRLSLDERKALAKSWSDFLKSPGSSPKTKALVVLVLGILGTERPDSLSPEISNQVAVELLDLLFHQTGPAKWRVAAVELMGKGFEQWSHHIKEVGTVIHKLFSLSMVQSPASLTKTAHHALMLIGAREPRSFIQAIGRRFGMQTNSTGGIVSSHIPEVSPQEHAQALSTIAALIKKHPSELLPELPLLVEIIVQSLDPHVPFLRDSCLKPATSLIHDLVRRYPMISFQQTSQRLAVGTTEAIVYIYDLTSATRWHTLEGHSKQLSALSFSQGGKILATYSIGDAQIKLWKMSSSFFGILPSTPHCYRTIEVKRITKVVTPALLIECVKLQWAAKQKLILVHSWDKEGPQTFII